MKVAAVQHDIIWEDPPANFERLGSMIAAAALTRGHDYSSAASVHGSADRSLKHVPAGGHGIASSSPVPRGEVHRYDKPHPFSHAGEDQHYDAGDRTVTVMVEGVRVTPFVCYDLRFGDAFWRAAAQTDLFVVVANWPAPRRSHWLALLVARAIENQAYVAGVNRVGIGGGLEYAGDSRVFGPSGESLAAAGSTETTLLADVDPTMVADVRHAFPTHPDRR